jgi:hypothetical protein
MSISSLLQPAASINSIVTSSPALSTAVGFLGGELSTLVLTKGRSIGPTTGSGPVIAAIIPNVTISEHHHDELEITDHPVEAGAAITDHAYNKPSEVTCEYSSAGSGGSISQALSNDIAALTGGRTTPSALYLQLLALQQSRQPFNLVTGKRAYTNMLMKSLEVTTDIKKENVLSFKCTFRQVIIVNTQTVTMTPASQQLNPAATAQAVNQGVTSAIAVPAAKTQSILSSLLGG